MRLDQLRRAWDSFWFAEASPLPVSVFRILVGLLALQFCWWISPDLKVFFGYNGVLPVDAVRQSFGIGSIVPASDDWLLRMHSLLFVSALCLTLGLFSRVSAFVTYLGLLYFDGRNPYLTFQVINLLSVMTLYLCFSPCGNALSLDRLLGGSGKFGSVLGQRLMQVQLSLVYWSAFSSKLHGTTWMDGTAVYYATHIAMFKQFWTGNIFDHLWICQLLSWLTLMMEFSLFSLIWVKQLRYPVLLLGCGFHLGMDLALFIPMFQSVMLASYVNFIDASDLMKLMAIVRRRCRRHGLIPRRLAIRAMASKNAFALKLRSSVARPIVSAIILVYSSSMFIVFCPPSAFRNQFEKCIEPMMVALGASFNYWTFAPEPPKLSQTCSAVITFSDGSTKTWTCPNLTREELLKHPERIILMWQYVLWKWHCVLVAEGSLSPLATARYLAQMYKSPANQPVMVSLYGEYSPIIIPADDKPAGTPTYMKKKLCDWQVIPSEL